MIKKSWNKKRLLILILILFFIFLVVCIWNNFYKSTSKDFLPYELTTLSEILEHYECKFIKKSDSNEENIDTDISLKFNRDYYTEEQSNESYFTSLIAYISENLEYKNYNLIDIDREIKITVFNNKETQRVNSIYYNGNRNYFEIADNKQKLKQYQPTNIVDFTINSSELKQSVKNNWQSGKVNFGTEESTFEEYNIYFDEGIEVKTTASKIYNIVFTEKYNKEIVNGLRVNDSTEKIQEILGKPTFSNEYIVGYKGKECYIFFSKDEVSVYRVENNYKNEEFIAMIEEFMVNKKQVTLLNTLTNIWDDYDLYTVEEDSNILIRYTVKGIEISFTSIGGKITFYQNFGGKVAKDIDLTTLTEDNIPQYAKLELTTDLVFEEEKQRKDIKQCYYEEEFIETIHIDGYLEEEIDEQLLEKIENLQYKTNKFYVFSEKMTSQSGKFKFISIDKTYPNSELRTMTKSTDFVWLDDKNFIYTISRKRNLFI